MKPIAQSGTLRRVGVRPRSAWILFILVMSLFHIVSGRCQETAGAIASNLTKNDKVDNIPSQQAGASERWDVLSLAGNNLKAIPPLFGEEDVFPTFTRSLIQVQWRASDPIDLYVIRPAHAVKPPVVILLYGYPSDTDRFRDDAFCQALVKHGFGAVGFVSALTGHRYHDRPMKQWFVSELPEALGSSVHDVQMVLNYLATRGDLDMEHVGIFGQGSGGTIAILSASVDPRIRAVDVLDPWGDWPDWMASSAVIPDQERPGYLSPGFLESAAPFDPMQVLPQFKSRPLRLQQTQFSKITPAPARERIRSSINPGTETLQYKDVDDYNNNANKDARIFEWLQLQLHSVDGNN